MEVSIITIRVDNSDNSDTELTTTMPSEIVNKIMGDIINWKDDWLASTSIVEEYQKAEKEFLTTLSKDKK